MRCTIDIIRFSFVKQLFNAKTNKYERRKFAQEGSHYGQTLASSGGSSLPKRVREGNDEIIAMANVSPAQPSCHTHYEIVGRERDGEQQRLQQLRNISLSIKEEAKGRKQ
eukprot:TRINITY_DN40781_c0_g1_i1.p2 TRINITY_DN40781_c0_g1~~TRINITY_DN40781_c0_g1_i1.p2  ORF type:complete len:110 (-),score=23.37 TRINITY_DN40781_c0_g1_i1:128-457(-)